MQRVLFQRLSESCSWYHAPVQALVMLQRLTTIVFSTTSKVHHNAQGKHTSQVSDLFQSWFENSVAPKRPLTSRNAVPEHFVSETRFDKRRAQDVCKQISGGCIIRGVPEAGDIIFSRSAFDHDTGTTAC